LAGYGHDKGRLLAVYRPDKGLIYIGLV
jgi:hypothetical protein